MKRIGPVARRVVEDAERAMRAKPGNTVSGGRHAPDEFERRDVDRVIQAVSGQPPVSGTTRLTPDDPETLHRSRERGRALAIGISSRRTPLARWTGGRDAWSLCSRPSLRPALGANDNRPGHDGTSPRIAEATFGAPMLSAIEAQRSRSCAARFASGIGFSFKPFR